MSEDYDRQLLADFFGWLNGNGEGVCPAYDICPMRKSARQEEPTNEEHIDAFMAAKKSACYESKDEIKQEDTRMLIEMLSAASRISVTLSTAKSRPLPPWPAPTLDGAISSLTGHKLWRVDPMGDGKFKRIYGESRDPEARKEQIDDISNR